MLEDKIRTNAYRSFIEANIDSFKGRTVLDVGCGTGILSMFCAKAGAKKVFAVEQSAVAIPASENVYRNGLQGVITCVCDLIDLIDTANMAKRSPWLYGRCRHF